MPEKCPVFLLPMPAVGKGATRRGNSFGRSAAGSCRVPFCFPYQVLRSEPFCAIRIKDKRELVGKTTAIHAKFIAPHQTTILEFDKTKGPNGGLEEKLEVLPLDGSAILFPSEDSKSVSEMDWSKFKRILVLDGTWKQAKMMCLTSPMLKDLPKVHLPQSNETKFWRYQNLGPHCLATIEAIYQFYQEFSQQMQSAGSESHKFDNMLYFYVHLYNRVQEEYRQNQVKRFTHRHGKASEYIKYD